MRFLRRMIDRLLAAFSLRASDAPPDAICVDSVREEYGHLGRHPCACGGMWEVRLQGCRNVTEQLGRFKLDELQVECSECGRQNTFRFVVDTHSEAYQAAVEELARELGIDLDQSTSPENAEQTREPAGRGCFHTSGPYSRDDEQGAASQPQNTSALAGDHSGPDSMADVYSDRAPGTPADNLGVVQPGSTGIPAESPWSTNQQLAEIFTIRGLLGRGSMCMVYLADDDTASRKVAVKVPLGTRVGDPQTRERFVTEAKAWTELIHPHIVRAFDVRDDPSTSNRPAIFMDFCDGGSLANRIRGAQQLSIAEALDIAIQVCWAVEFAQDKGHLHRDLKPSNVLLRSDGRALVTDFGLAKSYQGEDLGLPSAQLSREDAELVAAVSLGGGTPEYMPPEQWAGRTERKSDIYSFGILLYELLCGCRPFNAETRAALRFPHETVPPPDPRQFKPQIPESLAELVLSCLAKRPEDRPADFGGVADALTQACELTAERDLRSRLAKPTREQISHAEQIDRAYVFLRLGQRTYLRDNLDDALRHFQQAERLFRELDDKVGLSASLVSQSLSQAMILRARGDSDGALRLLEEAERRCRDLADKRRLMANLGHQALILVDRHDVQKAMKLLDEVEDLAAECGLRPLAE